MNSNINLTKVFKDQNEHYAIPAYRFRNNGWFFTTIVIPIYRYRNKC
jgi:hypothetical protein